MYEHREADRVPILDAPWAGTIRRWVREGMPAGMDWEDYFGADKIGVINVDISPRFEKKILEENDRWYIATSQWGVTMKHFKEEDSTPEFLDYRVVDADSWAEAKARMTLDDDRIPWKMLKENFPKWRAEGRWIRAVFWFGFDVTHSWMMGTENLLIAMMEEPELAEDMFDTYLSRTTALYDRLWDAGYHFDEMFWYDDMGYKGTTFFSPAMYRNLLQPYHKRAVKWAHDHGIVAQLHSCGDIMAIVPDVVATGVDALNPLEVKAGMDVLKLKKEYGDRLVFRGGINAVNWNNTEAILAEINEKVPILKENGGFIFSSDHSVPNSVSLENFKAIIEEVKRVGKY
jgi:uroporphyrinogen decarboxylase